MNSKNLFINLPSILFICLPLLLITGPFLSDLAISLISLIYIFYIFYTKDFRIFKNRWFQFLLIFWIYISLNSFFNNLNSDSIRISLTYFRFIFFIFAISFLLLIKKNNLRNFFFSLLFCFVILIFDGFIQFFFGHNLLGFNLVQGPRVSSFFGDDLILGSYLSRLFPLLLGIYIFIYKKEKSQFLEYSLILIMILSGVIIFLSGERTALFYFILSNIFLIFFLKNFKRLRFFSLCISTLIIIISVLFNPSIKERMVDLTFEELQINKNETDFFLNDLDNIVIFTDQHTQHYKSAFRIYKDNLIFGVGIKNFRKICHEKKYKISEISCSTHPHNTYIQLLAELGTIGFLLISFLFFYFIGLIFRILKDENLSDSSLKDFYLCLIISILISLWPISPSGNFFNNWLNIIYYLPAGFILFIQQSKKNFTDLKK
jgi:O-antigen ligase